MRALALVAAAAFVVVTAAACPDCGGGAGPDAGVGGRDADGNLNGTAGPDRTSGDCGEPVPINLSFCQNDVDSCHADADCDAQGAGLRCYVHQPHCECRPTCLDDGDCPQFGFACACDSDQCVPAECHTGADCDTGHCGAQQEPGGCRETRGFKCRKLTDPCDSDDDCPEPFVGDAVCESVDAGFACGNVSGDPCNDIVQ